MLIAFNDKITKEYSLKSDVEEPKTKFVLGTFDTFVRAKLESNIAKMGTDSDAQIFWIVQIVKHGLKGWTLEVPFKKEEVDVPGVGKRVVASDESIMKLKLEWINELANEIILDNLLQGKELKN
jgi:hypothetical protein